jgi:hypothetical protein
MIRNAIHGAKARRSLKDDKALPSFQPAYPETRFNTYTILAKHHIALAQHAFDHEFRICRDR